MTATYESPLPQHTAAYLWPIALSVLPLAPARILDVGCGNGAFDRTLVELGYSVAACDPSASGVRLASEGIPAIDARVMSVEDELPQDWRGAFDAVVSLEVIEHLYQPRLLVQRAVSALRAGGVCIVSTPYHGYLKHLAIALTARSESHFDPLWDGGHIKFFTPRSLHRLLEQGGLVDVRFRFAGRLPWLWKSMVTTARKAHTR